MIFFVFLVPNFERPQVEVKFTEEPKPSYVIKILNAPNFNAQYGKGFFVSIRNDDSGESAYAERVYVSNVESFYLQSTFLCKVQATFWIRRETHFGFGPASTKVTFQGGESGGNFTIISIPDFLS